MIHGGSRELAQRLLARPFRTERAITVDQSNESVVVDDAVVVKWMRPPVPAPHPGVELMRHLAAWGFTEMPALLGVDERDGHVHAIVTAYLPGAVDGWEWFVDDVDRWIAGVLPFEHLRETSARLGAITVRMHVALEDMQPGPVDLVGVADRAVADLRLARERLHELDWLDDAAVIAALEPMRGAGTSAGHRIHGDLHAGQFLRSGDTLLVTDFDGNPLHDATHRAAPQSPLRDVAGLLQSIVHVGAVVVKRRRPDRAGDVDRFVSAGVDAALASYAAVNDVDRELLHAFRVAQELHEYAYSIERLPHWRYVADDALPRLLAAPP